MKSKYIIVLFLAASQIAWGQDKNLSLNEAVQIALSNRYDLKIERVNTQISENEIKKINTRKLPQLTGDVDWRYNTQLQTNMMPIGTITGNPNLPDQPVRFGTKFNTAIGLNLNQSVFNPANLGDKRIANAQLGYEKISEKVTENQIKAEVTEAYYSVLIWTEKVRLSTDNVSRTNAVFTTAKEQLANGAITTYDYKRYEIDFENANAENNKNKNNLNLAMADLWYKIGIEPLNNVVLSDNIEQLFSVYANAGLEEPVSQRPEIEMEKQQQEIYKLQIQKQNLSYYPTISITGNYTLQFLNNEYKIFNSDYWFPYNYLGLKVSVPIFDGLLKERTKNEYKLRIQSSNLQLEKLKKDYSQEVSNAVVSLKNAQSDMEYQKKNLELVNYLYSVEQDKLAKGTITPNDLAATYYTVQQTQNNYLNAVYDYLVALIAYKRATGDL